MHLVYTPTILLELAYDFLIKFIMTDMSFSITFDVRVLHSLSSIINHNSSNKFKINSLTYSLFISHFKQNKINKEVLYPYFDGLYSCIKCLQQMSQYFRKYIKQEHYPNPSQNIKFKTSFRNCVYKGLHNRQWRETDGDDWNIMWCEKEQIDWVFQKYRFQPGAKANHFRGWNELCRKDMLSKNLKKFKRNLEKQGNSTQSNQYDFLPPTFLMPSEYVIFYEQFKKHQHNDKILWIMKPTSKCQGKGIFIFNKIGDINRWKGSNKEIGVQNYVCQRYILNPLLFGGRKFDMRIYALCTSYNPLTVYIYRNGFARFAHDHYDNIDLDNLYKHLTNVAINMNAPTYVKRIGGKWFLDNLKNFMLSKFGIEKTNQSFSDVQRCIIKSLRAVQKLVTNSPHSFQLYGYDFLFDSDGKAWLLQVNGGPSMTANTPQDSTLKVGLIDDVMTIINLQGVLKGDEQVIGGFDLIYKQKPVNLPQASIYTSMLGCRCNRIQNMRKLARSCAYRLSKEYLQKQAARLKEESKKKQQNVNKFQLRNTKPRSNNVTNPVVTNPNLRKKIDNVNTEFIRYISQREDRKTTNMYSNQLTPNTRPEDEDEQ